MALHVSVLEPKMSKVLTFAISRKNLYLYIVILKCYQTVIQYLDNVTSREFDHSTVDTAVRQNLIELTLVLCHVTTLVIVCACPVTVVQPCLLLWSILVSRIGETLKK